MHSENSMPGTLHNKSSHENPTCHQCGQARVGCDSPGQGYHWDAWIWLQGRSPLACWQGVLRRCGGPCGCAVLHPPQGGPGLTTCDGLPEAFWGAAPDATSSSAAGGDCLLKGALAWCRVMAILEAFSGAAQDATSGQAKVNKCLNATAF